jgi:hypothetical protein
VSLENLIDSISNIISTNVIFEMKKFVGRERKWIELCVLGHQYVEWQCFKYLRCNPTSNKASFATLFPYMAHGRLWIWMRLRLSMKREIGEGGEGYLPMRYTITFGKILWICSNDNLHGAPLGELGSFLYDSLLERKMSSNFVFFFLHEKFMAFPLYFVSMETS